MRPWQRIQTMEINHQVLAEMKMVTIPGWATCPKGVRAEVCTVLGEVDKSLPESTRRFVNG